LCAAASTSSVSIFGAFPLELALNLSELNLLDDLKIPPALSSEASDKSLSYIYSISILASSLVLSLTFYAAVYMNFILYIPVASDYFDLVFLPFYFASKLMAIS
jgi:hypothetical protein